MGNITVRFTKRTNISTINHVGEKMALECFDCYRKIDRMGRVWKLQGANKRPLLTICSSLGTAIICLFQYTRKLFTLCPKGDLSIGLSRTVWLSMWHAGACAAEKLNYISIQSISIGVRKETNIL